MKEMLAQCTQKQLYNAATKHGVSCMASRRLQPRVQLLSNHLPTEKSRDIRRFDWHLLWNLCHPTVDAVDLSDIAEKEGTLHSMLLLPEGNTLAIGARRGVVLTWDVNRRAIIGRFQAHQAHY